MAFTLDLVLWHYAMDITSVSNATIIVNSAPILIAILSYILFKEKPLKALRHHFLLLISVLLA